MAIKTQLRFEAEQSQEAALTFLATRPHPPKCVLRVGSSNGGVCMAERQVGDRDEDKEVRR